MTVCNFNLENYCNNTWEAIELFKNNTAALKLTLYSSKESEII